MVVNFAAVETVSTEGSGWPAAANAARIEARRSASAIQSAALPSASAALSRSAVVIAVVVNGGRPLDVAEIVTPPLVVVTLWPLM